MTAVTLDRSPLVCLVAEPPHPTQPPPPPFPGGRINDKFPVVVTSYEILLADIKFMAKYQWKYIVVDEARAGEGGLGCGAGKSERGELGRGLGSSSLAGAAMRSCTTMQRG